MPPPAADPALSCLQLKLQIDLLFFVASAPLFAAALYADLPRGHVALLQTSSPHGLIKNWKTKALA